MKWIKKGVIFAPDNNYDWMVSVDYDPAGYIKDEDAKNWNADELLQNLKDGTEAANENRVRLGIPALEVTRWIEPPAYDSATQRLVWSAEGRDKGAAADSDNTVNYNTYLLGREGYVSLDLITSTSKIESQKAVARNLLAAVNFNDGKRYADYDASSDKVAACEASAAVRVNCRRAHTAPSNAGQSPPQSFQLPMLGTGVHRSVPLAFHGSAPDCSPVFSRHHRPQTSPNWLTARGSLVR